MWKLCKKFSLHGLYCCVWIVIIILPVKKTKFAQMSPHQHGPVIDPLGYRIDTYPIWLAETVLWFK